MTFQYLIQTDTEPIAVSLTASGRIALSQDGVTVYLPGASWDNASRSSRRPARPRRPDNYHPGTQRAHLVTTSALMAALEQLLKDLNSRGKKRTNCS